MKRTYLGTDMGNSSGMKTIFQINSVANLGSTGRIAEGIGEVALNIGWKSYIAYGVSASSSKSTLFKIGKRWDFVYHVIKTRLFDLHGLGSKRATKKLINEIENVNPDIILLHNLHGYYINIEILFSFLKKAGKPVFWTLYDCWAFTGHCAYFDLVSCTKWEHHCGKCPAIHTYPGSWFVDNSAGNHQKKQEVFSGVDNLTLIVNSNWLKDHVNRSFLKDYPIKLVRNGINVDNFKPSSYKELLEEHALFDKFVILGIANKWSPRKGLTDFILLSKYLSNDEVIVLDGLDDVQRKDLPSKVIALKRAASVQELAKLYSLGGVFFNPTYEDNFPTTNLEALACGTPVVTYNTGGSPEAVDVDTGFVVERGNITKAYEAIKIIKGNRKEHYTEKCRSRAKRHFDYQDRYFDYLQLFQENLENH